MYLALATIEEDESTKLFLNGKFSKFQFFFFFRKRPQVSILV